MSGKNREDKDSYAKDTLAFRVPLEAQQNNRNVNNPNYQRQYPQGQRPQGQYSQGQYPQGQRPQGQRSQGQLSNQINRQNTQQHSGQPRSNYRRNSGHQNSNVNSNRQKPPVQKRNNTTRNNQQVRANNAQRQKAVKVKKTKRRGGCLTKILMSIIGLFLILFILYSIIVMTLINKVNIVDDGERISSGNSLMSSSNVRNILLIGTDSRGEDRGRSDSMILLSINSKTNKINMVSLMRDTYVQVPGYGGCKLNAAYSYGGPELLMDTIEDNFYIEIDDYVTVNFISFANIVDAVGGVEIEVNDSEADAINALLDSKEGVSMF